MEKYFPVTLKIDDEEIKIRIKRMDLEESGDFNRGLVKTGAPVWERFISRNGSGPEQERKSDGFFVIPFEALKDEKLLELTDERRAEYDAAEEQHEKESRAFLVWAFESFLTVESGLLEDDDDGREIAVTDGLDFLRVFGARLEVLQEALSAIRLENSLDAAQKKVLQSATVSSRFSAELGSDPVGPKPAPIVESAEIEASVKIEDATNRHPGPSGSTESSKLIPVPS